MEWTFKNKIIQQLPDDCVGFVYIITNTTNNIINTGNNLIIPPTIFLVIII